MRKRDRVASIKGYYCFYCNRPLLQSDTDWGLDHVIPKSLKGANTIENLVPSCNRCNTMKSSLSIKEFHKKLLRKREEIKVIERMIKKLEENFLLYED